ncbi:MAG: ATP synthase F1 subunit delta [Bacteroidales bacterium]|jgi:F-type H+-transporting ATPase subunit delta|nr:ATP synthase F1 subunit delta [Bacteroidales bacterium]
MLFNTVSLRYAKALIELCNEKNLTESVYANMKEMQYLLAESYELRNFLKTPQIDDKTKSSLVKKIFAPYFQEVTVSFLTLLIRKGRSDLIIYIVYQFIELYRQQTGIILAQVRSATPMSETMQQKIVEKVKTATGSDKIEIDVQIDKTLLGGYKLYFNGKSYDASIKKELDEIKSLLTSNKTATC